MECVMETIKLNQFLYRKFKPTGYLFYIIAITLVAACLVFQPGSLTMDQIRIIGGSYDSKLATYLFSLLVMMVCALTPLPAELIALTNTFIYSPVEAFFVTWLSAVMSAEIGYEFGRLNNLNPCRYKDSNKVCHWLNKYGYKALAIMRLIPIVPFFALNICGGILKLNRYKYTLVTAFTIMPAVTLLTFFPHLFM